MKKILKIVALILLVIIFVVSFGRMLEYSKASFKKAESYRTVVEYLKQDDPINQEYTANIKLELINYILIATSYFLNFIFSAILIFFIFLCSYKEVNIKEKFEQLKNDLISKIHTKKEEKKNQKIAKMKAKIEKMESDE